MKNQLLNSLSAELQQALKPHLAYTALKQEAILHKPKETINAVYFPLSCLLSITITMSDGKTAETGLIGNRGVLGINAFIDQQATTQTEYVVQVAGDAMQLEATIAYKLFQECAELRKVILGYSQVFIAQISQTTACNRLHSLEQRLARWLLEAEDGLNTNHIPLTHKFVSEMLGVRRAGVTEAAQKLQKQGSIQYHHGNIQIVDRVLLESAACECFRVAKNEYDRLLGPEENRNPDRNIRR